MGRILLPNRNIARLGFNVHVGMEGYYGLKKINKFSGKVTQEIKPFHNLILDQGLTNYFLGSSWNNGSMAGMIAVGTGNATPLVSDTQLQSWVTTTWAGDGNYTVGYVAAASPIPAYWYARYSYLFNTGTAAGNLSEIGTAPENASPSNIPLTNLGSRALIVDVNGNPTTITVLSDEILTATYELRYYLDTTDHSFTVNLNGSPITGVYRLCNITAASSSLVWNVQNNSGGSDTIALYSGDINVVTGVPSGQLGTNGTSKSTLIQIVNDLANTGTCYMDRYYTFPTSVGNGTIKSIQITNTMWNYQFGNLSTPIVKTNGQQLQINYRLSWGRH